MGQWSVVLERYYNGLFQREKRLLQEGIQFYLLLEKHAMRGISKSSRRFIALFQKEPSVTPLPTVHTHFLCVEQC